MKKEEEQTKAKQWEGLVSLSNLCHLQNFFLSICLVREKSKMEKMGGRICGRILIIMIVWYKKKDKRKD